MNDIREEVDGQVERLSCQLNCESKCVDFLRSMVGVMAERVGMDACHSNRVALAVDELFANIAEHGYAGKPGRIEFEARINGARGGAQELVFNFRDYVKSDWTHHGCESDSGECAGELSPGGLGLRLIEEVADCFEQSKLADGNSWHLVFCVGKTG